MHAFLTDTRSLHMLKAVWSTCWRTQSPQVGGVCVLEGGEVFPESVHELPSWWVPWRSKRCVAEYSRARDAILRKSRLTCPLKDDLEQTRKTNKYASQHSSGREDHEEERENRVGLGKTSRRKLHSGRSRRVLVNVTESKDGEVSHWDHSWHFYCRRCFHIPQNHLLCPGRMSPAVTTQHLWNLQWSPESSVAWHPHSLEPVPRLQHRAVWVTWPSLPSEDVSSFGLSGFSPLPCKSRLWGWYNYQHCAWYLAGPVHVSSGWTRCTFAVEATFPSTLWWSPRCMELTPASCVLCS